MGHTPSILLIGFGYVANHTARRLSTQGWRVLASTRSVETAAEIGSAGHHAVLADPASEEGASTLRAAAADCEAIVSSVPPGPDGDPVLPALNEADLTGKRLIYLSTTGVYGDRGGGWAFEADPVTPGHARSIRRAQAEAAWLERGAISLRLGGIYGPGRSAFDRQAGERPVFDKPGQVFSRIHVDDIAAAIEAALARPEVTGPVNIVDDAPSSQVEVMTGAARMAGLPAPEIQPFDPDQASPMLASFFAENRRVSNARAKAALGWRPAYPDWRSGLAAIGAQTH
ncbi:MAG: SDR family NAD(P)-dependent oxidoreductase [Alphaproteobacteria bacterium]|nr:SDR family NAD(P)-dependent oxidoreductase [Alphaproteobacteria bacterium]